MVELFTFITCGFCAIKLELPNLIFSTGVDTYSFNLVLKPYYLFDINEK